MFFININFLKIPLFPKSFLNSDSNFTQEQIKELKKRILYNTRDYAFPILYNVDIGHTDPSITIPLGVQVVLDSEKNRFEILESAVSE